MKTFLPLSLFLILSAPLLCQSATASNQYWMRVKASTQKERTQISNLGVAIENVTTDDVVAFGNEEQKLELERRGILQVSYVYTQTADFPPEDSSFHTYDQLVAELKDLAAKNPNLVKLTSIGKSLQGRDLWTLTISSTTGNPDQLPGIFFLGTHHAREHVSTEMPLLLAKYLVDQFNGGNANIKKLLSSREVFILPLVNPDGAEYDTDGGRYHMWRKNLASDNGKVYGVDLNRNYGYKWGGEGAGVDPDSETYRGPNAFSEPETQSIKAFIDGHSNLTSLLTFHTYSELILYPWGYTTEGISEQRDRQVFETMAQTMAKWNGYTPEQSSSLYTTSGDTTDWAYGVHKIFAFTFELDPSSIMDGGFYPGQASIQPVFQKNLQPCLYMMEYADNPYRVLNPNLAYGLSSNLLSQKR